MATDSQRLTACVGLAKDNPFPSGELSRVVRGVGIYPLSGLK
jgi:hypothetical protein